MNRDIRDRYLNDAIFYKAVNIIKHLINEETGLTSLCIRDAAYYARVLSEIENPRPVIMSGKINFDEDLK